MCLLTSGFSSALDLPHELFMQIVLGFPSICMQHLFDMMLFVVALRHITFLFYYEEGNSRLFMNLCRDDGEQIPSHFSLAVMSLPVPQVYL